MRSLIAYVLLLKSLVLCEINNQIVNKEAEQCGGTCDRTYTLHTYPSADHLEACKRGCRLFAVLHVLGESGSLNSTRQACDSSCMEAYNKSALHYACNLGCNSQTVAPPETDSQQEKEEPHLLKPLVYIQVVYSNLAGHVKQFVSHSWSIYMQQGKLVQGQDKPQIIQEIESEDDGLLESHEMDLNEDKFDFGIEETRRIPFTVVRGRPSSGIRRQEYLHIQSMGSSVSLDWLSCISRQSGLPRRLLLLVLMLAVVVMVWLCCATAATAPEQRIKSQNIEFYNDLTYLLDHQQAEKIKIQPPPSYSLVPPLPMKVKPEDNLV